MRLFLASFLVTAIASLAGTFAVGRNLGAIFVLYVVAALVAPAFTRWRELLGVVAGLTLGVLVILFRDLIDPRQFPGVLLSVLAFAVAAGAIARPLGVAAAVAISVAWLAGPIWLSPWMTDSLADLLGRFHPLLTINMAVPQYGLWIQGPHMYHLTNLGQDVHVPLADTVWPSVMLHLGVAIAIRALPPVWWLWQKRQPAPAAQ